MTAICLFSPACNKKLALHTPEQNMFAESDRSSRQTDTFNWLNLVRSESEDLSLSKAFRFTWHCSGGSLAAATVECAEDPGFTVGVLRFPSSESHMSAIVHSLKTGVSYYWRVIGTDAKGKKVESDVRKFETEWNPPRWVRADGVSNVRDCGAWQTKSGRRIRQGLVYRGGEMNRHMTITEDGIRFMDRQIGLRTLVDFRYGEEIAALGGKGSAMPSHVRWINVTLYAYDGCFKDDMSTHYAQAFRILLNPENLPAYVHCWGGADRTGTFVFLLNAVLGVDEDALLLDYELTSLAIWGARSRNLDLFQNFLAGLEALAPGKSLEEKACAYFKSGGITDDEIARMKDLLLEK